MSTPVRKARLTWLDWLRGVSVLVMIEAHSFDAWTMPAEKSREAYGHLMLLGGFASPLFLFLAGTAAALAAAAHARRGLAPIDAARKVERRGLEILLLAFLFRLQSYVLSGLAHPENLLKVDILNVMGPAIVATAAFWRIPVSPVTRSILLGLATAAIAIATPSIRQAAWVEVLPPPLAGYLRPAPGGAFAMFPWIAFVPAGAIVGIALDAGRRWGMPRLHLAFAAAGLCIAGIGYAASFGPQLFEGARFWTTSPAYFCFRVGILVLAVAAAWAWVMRRWAHGPSPVEALGVGSLFVYWVHVELVYGVLGRPLRGRLTLEQNAVAFLGLTVLMYVLLMGWNRLRAGRLPRVGAASLAKSST